MEHQYVTTHWRPPGYGGYRYAIFRTECSCSWQGHWQPRSGLALAEFDAHVEQQEQAA